MPNQDSIKSIIDGVSRFQENVFKDEEALFQRLKGGQQPKVLFITCSDSRIDTSMLTQSKPGDLFIIRNAGNIVPPHNTSCGGITASIEYAVSVLNVEHIIICGHSHCGAMGGVLHPENVESLPSVKSWLAFAEATRGVVEAQAKDCPEQEKLDYCAEQNVLIQLNNLKTLPSVAKALASNTLQLHGWMYRFEKGCVMAYSESSQQFESLTEAYPIAETMPV